MIDILGPVRPLFRFIDRILPFVDVFLFPFVYPAGFLLKLIRRGGVHRMPLSKRALLQVGVFPIRNHYYEPKFDTRDLVSSSVVRELPGVDWNVEGQLALLASFDYSNEIESVIRQWTGTPAFHFNNDVFEAGDAEFWYSMVRSQKPRTIIEIGSGYSTLIASKAVERNRIEDPGYTCRQICIEPYEAPWLESLGVTVQRTKVEEVAPEIFGSLQANDILFIDSSHIVRPRGDVLTEYLQILPRLNPGVIVHVHDIFTPRDYPDEWIKEKVFLWNEQYMVEAFLTHNRDWEVLAALNFLHHGFYDRMKAKCPFLAPDNEPGSLYLRKR
jgi:hypothetical protein